LHEKEKAFINDPEGSGFVLKEVKTVEKLLHGSLIHCPENGSISNAAVVIYHSKITVDRYEIYVRR